MVDCSSFENENGQEGSPMKKRRTYSGAFKAKVVGELLNGRMSLQGLAELYGIHPNQIKNWRTLLIKRAHLVFDDRRRR